MTMPPSRAYQLKSQNPTAICAALDKIKVLVVSDKYEYVSGGIAIQPMFDGTVRLSADLVVREKQ